MVNVTMGGLNPPGRPDDLSDGIPRELLNELPERADSTDANGQVDRRSVPTYPPGSSVECPDCGRTFKVTRAGLIRSHKCVPVAELPEGTPESVMKVVRTARKTTRVNRKVAPPSVRKWGIIGIAAAAESFATQTVVSATGADKHEIPEKVTALPAPEAMCGPIVDNLWPALPPRAQQAIMRIADQDAFIECGLLWYVYMQGLRQWSNEFARQHPDHRARKSTQVQQDRQRGKRNGASTAASGIDAATTNGGGSANADGFGIHLPDGLKAGRDR